MDTFEGCGCGNQERTSDPSDCHLRPPRHSLPQTPPRRPISDALRASQGAPRWRGGHLLPLRPKSPQIRPISHRFRHPLRITQIMALLPSMSLLRGHRGIPRPPTPHPSEWETPKHGQRGQRQGGGHTERHRQERGRERGESIGEEDKREVRGVG